VLLNLKYTLNISQLHIRQYKRMIYEHGYTVYIIYKIFGRYQIWDKTFRPKMENSHIF